MIQKGMSTKPLKNYIKPSNVNGWYKYRRAIPQKYRESFVTEKGRVRGLEWQESLKTTSKAMALRKAAEINDRFERTLAMAKYAEKRSNPRTTEQEKIDHFLEMLQREGLHPDQAPNVLAPEHTRKEWLKKRETFLSELYDLLHTIGLEEIDFHETRKTEHFDLIDAQIKFVEGNNSAIKSRLSVTLGAALELYLEDKFYNRFRVIDPETKKKIDRVERVTKNFATFIGNGFEIRGLETRLGEITRQSAKAWWNDQLAVKTASTVARDVTPLGSIYNHAVKERKDQDGSLSFDSNPFKGLSSEAQRKDDEDVRVGYRVRNESRAWTPKELHQFMQRFQNMNPEAAIISKITMFTGARLKDCSGLLVRDLVLEDDENSKIKFEDNIIRSVSKDSIQRHFPIFGELLTELKDYVAARELGVGDPLTPKYGRSGGSSALSDLLSQKHIRTFTDDRSLRMHGMRDTLQANFDAANMLNKVSGYLIGWRNQQTVGMQENYNKQGYPHSQMLEAVKAAHSVTDWATLDRLR